MEHWYLIYTKKGREQVATEQLQRQGFCVYLPRIELQRRRRGQWRPVIEPLFPRYLFLQINPDRDSMAPIRSTIGVSSIVRFGTSPCEVPPTVIDYLKQREDRQSGVIPSERPALVPGQRVEIATGPFAGLQAIFQQPKGSDRALILLDLLGKQNRLTLHQNDLIPVG